MESASLAYANSSHSAVVQALCRDVLNDGINLNISAADEMLLFFKDVQGYPVEQAAAMYFESGRRIWRTLRQILVWRFGSLSWGGRVLDFASGFGRVTRHIAAEIAPESIWVADIYAEGVAFQQRHFGVHGVVSSTEPDRFPGDRTFDAIFVSSLFTHLPEPRFMEWLHRLGSLVNPGGVLLFSVHDMSLRSRETAASTPGIVFEELSESGSLDTREYGSSWVTEEFVRSAVRNAIGPCPVLRIPRGLASFQDLYVVLMGEASDSPAVFSGLEVEREPDGFFEHCSWAGKRTLHLSGWVGDRVTKQAPQEVLIRIDGVLVATCRDLQPRPQVDQAFAADPMEAVGWQATVEIPPGADPAAARLSIGSVSSEGEELNLYSGPILWACLRSAQLDCAMLHNQMTRREAAHAEELARQRDTCESRIAELAGRVHWMEASRFWKARNLWFRFKRAAGLTEEL